MTLNPTGIEPTEFNVLVRLERAAEKTAGSIILPGTKVDRDQSLNTVGTLVAASPLAFSYDAWEGVAAEFKPQVGQKVRIAKGAGEYIDDKDSGDGEFYRLLKDKDVTAIMRDVAPVAVKKAKAA